MAQSSQQIEKAVRMFVLEETDWSGSIDELTPAYDLIGGGVLDSIGVFRVLTAIEEEYGIEVPDDEIRLEMFESIGAIVGLVEARLGA